MQFNAATVLSLLPALGMAIALPQAGVSPGSNQCDVSTFNNGAELSITTAPVADCEALVKNIDTTQTWSVASSWARLETYGECAFSVRTIVGQNPGLIGGADLVDLVNDSVTKFGAEGVVACTGQYAQVVSSEGEVDCNGIGEKVRVEWIVASSAYNPQ